MEKIKLDNRFHIIVTNKETNSNYSKFANVFDKGSKLPMFGTTFKTTATNVEIIEWANKKINTLS